MNSEALDTVADFPYLYCTVAYNNSTCADLSQNLRKAQRWWEMVENAVTKTEAIVRAWIMLYKSVLQSVLIYVSESWVVMGAMIKVLEGFHHLV